MAKKTQPILIIIDGPMGAGKTTLTEALRKKLSRTAIVSLDKVKMMISDYNKSPADLSVAGRVGAGMARAFIAEGMSVLVEKAFTEDRWLKLFLEDVGLPKTKTYIYQLECSLPTAWARVKNRQKGKPKKKQQPKSKVVRNHTHFQEGRYVHAKVFDTEKLSTAQIAKEILAELSHG